MIDKEEALAIIQALAENQYIGICILNRDGIAIYRSKINEELTGIKNENVLGKHYTAVPHHKDLLEVLNKGVAKLWQPFKTISGQKAMIQRFPLKQGDKIVGAMSIISIKNINEMISLAEEYNLLKDKLKYFNTELRRLRSTKYTFDNIIGTSLQNTNTIKTARSYAEGHSPVLITGETGTGKELFAQSIHMASNRCDGPFVRVNCGAIPSELIESELFGYEEGAFTGAKRGTKIGKFELAEGGTIFLDEISSLSLSLQPKLLAVLQNREIERIGGNRPIKIDFRVISATNKNLQEMIDSGDFRSDLYYRLGVLPINLSPLREKLQDIYPLANHFVQEFNTEYGFNISDINDDVLEVLTSWTWPGNIRELRNVIEHAVQMSDKKHIRNRDLPEYLVTNYKLKKDRPKTKNYFNAVKSSRENVEKKLIESTLLANKWNKSRSAEQLGISRPHLYALIKKFKLKR
jgi:transcriptional regulator with PAS, ATPase and Fis domain